MALSAAQKRVSLLPGVDNNRAGEARGDDGELRIVRTFHARFTGLKLGGGRSARERVAYVFREGKHAKDKADVEASAGDKKRLIKHADRIKATARVRRGRTAERILVEQIVELPAESTLEQRARCARAFVDSWIARGHEAVAVVHVHGDDKDKPQPHLHVEIAARPVDEAGNVDRSDVLWRGRASVYEERRIVAGLVNETCDPKPPYHPGGFRDIGRKEDKPKGRIPPAVFRPAAAEIREARAAGDDDRAGKAAATMYTLGAERRAPLHEAHQARRDEIAALKTAGEWKGGKPIGARAAAEAKIAAAERSRDFWFKETEKETAATIAANRELEAERQTHREATHRLVEIVYEHAGAELPDLETEDGQEQAVAFLAAGAGRPEERRMLEVKASDAEMRAEEAERQAREVNARQTAYLADVHRRAGRELPDLASEEGQSAAWAFLREVTENGLAVSRARAEEEERRRALERQEARKAERAKAMREEAARRALDALRTSWTRERQAREKYAERRRGLLDASWTSKDQMVRGFKQEYDMEAGMIRMVDGKARNATGEERQWRAEAVAVHDMLYEAAGKAGVDFGYGVAQPAWRIERATFLDHARTVSQDENRDRAHVAFPRVAGTPELVHDRERDRWNYRVGGKTVYWSEQAADWESAAGIMHRASVRDALERSDRVPDKVAADYPDLAPVPPDRLPPRHWRSRGQEGEDEGR